MPSHVYDLFIDLGTTRVQTRLRAFDSRSYRAIVEVYRSKAFGHLSKKHFFLIDCDDWSRHAIDDPKVASHFSFDWSQDRKKDKQGAD